MIVSFIGPRKVRFTEKLWYRIKDEIERLIVNDNADMFLFSYRNGEFEHMCYEAVTELRFKYKHINRVYVGNSVDRSKGMSPKLLPIFFDRTTETELYEKGRKLLIKMNEDIIIVSDVIVGYLNNRAVSFKRPFSVIQFAVDYANKNGKRILNIIGSRE